MTPHLFSLDSKVWYALTYEELNATVAGLHEMNLYHLPYDGEIILRIVFNAGYYMEIKGIRPTEEFSWNHVLIAHKRDRAPEFKLERTHKDGHRIEEGIVPIVSLPPEFVGNQALYRFRVYETALSVEAQRKYWMDGLVSILASKGLEKHTRHPKLHKLGIGSKTGEYVTTIRLSPSLEAGTHEEARPGMPVRPHLRRGHIRTQHYGPGNQLTKRIWIDPVFVNADEGFVSTRTAYRIVH